MKAKKFIAAFMAFAVIFTMSACGKKNDEDAPVEDESSDTGIKVYQTELETADEVETVQKELTYDVTGIENNISEDAELSSVRIVKYNEDYYYDEEEEIKELTVDIYHTTTSDFMKALNVEYCKIPSLSLASLGFLFEGKGYVRYKDPTDISSYGSVIFVETYGDIKNGENKIVTDDEATSGEDSINNYIKGIAFSQEYMTDGFELTFYGGIKMNDEQTDVEKKLGTGTSMQGAPDGINVVYYKNSKNTMILVYEQERDDYDVGFGYVKSSKLIEAIVLNNGDLT